MTSQGCAGDYNHFRETMCRRWRNYDVNNRAVSLLTEESIEEIRKAGWPVEPGHLGENLTLSGHVLERSLKVGQVWQVGPDVLLQIAEPIKPCNQLQHLPYVGVARRRDFVRALEGKRGWYAKVLKEGEVKVGDTFYRR